MSDHPEPATSRADRWLIAGWIAAASIALAGTVHDTDPYWQVRAGEEVLQGTPLTRPDTWSWAPVDGLFYPNSPAWNLVLALAWRALGAWGLYLVTVLSIAACLGLVAWLALRLGARAVPTVLVVVVSVAAVLPVFSPRAALPAFTLVLVAVAAGTKWAARAASRSVASNAAVVVTMGFAISVTGNWIHLSWSTFAATTAAAWTVLWIMVPDLPRRLRVALVAGGTLGLLAGVVAGPYGLDVVAQSQRVVDACRGLILEWSSPFDPGTIARWGLPAAFALLLLVAAVIWLLRSGRGRPKTSARATAAALTVAAVPYVLAGSLYIRFLLVAVPLLAPVAALLATRLFDVAHAHAGTPSPTSGYFRRRLPEWSSDHYWGVVLWAVLVVVTPFALFAGSQHSEPATEALNRLLPMGCRYFGTSSEAASVILERPDVKVWIDGRADYWGRERNQEAQRYLTHADPDRLVPPGTTCVVLSEPGVEPMTVPLMAALDSSPDWRRVPGTSGANLWLPAS